MWRTWVLTDGPACGVLRCTLERMQGLKHREGMQTALKMEWQINLCYKRSRYLVRSRAPGFSLYSKKKVGGNFLILQ